MQERSVFRLIVMAASLVIIIAGLKVMASLLGPILLSLFVVLIGYPLMSWLKRRGTPGWLAYTGVVLGVIAVGLVFILFLGMSLTQLYDALPAYQDRIDQQLSTLEQWLATYNIQVKQLLQLKWFDPSEIFQLLFYFVQGLLDTIGNTALTLLIFIYMLASASNFIARLERGLASDLPLLSRFRSFASSISTYLLIKSWLGALTAIVQIILMWILGVDFAILWGVLSFLFNFIPNIGFYIALIPPVVVALIEFGLTKAIILAVGYTLINNFFDVVIGPRYLGEGLDLSVVVTFLAVILWAWILGPIGAFMALPLTLMLKKLVLETFSDTQLLASLMSSDSGEQQ
ncbi:MAG: AI-2E family transporter [Prochloraceae cyanobacterium]